MHLLGAYSSSYNTPGSSEAITTPSESPSSMNINSSIGPVRPSAGRVTPRSAPYSKQPSNRLRGKKLSQNHESAQAQRNLFNDLPTDSIIPPLLECWKGANHTIDVAHVSARYQCGNLPKLTMVTPEPAVFASADNDKATDVPQAMDKSTSGMGTTMWPFCQLTHDHQVEIINHGLRSRATTTPIHQHRQGA
ncbi:hypothetical protein PQX77_017800 [Marasmius sp. AFHP31]|nr:hypothetical protein PQX77_017800 [Marasmius sp. AFHP31]